MIWAGLALVAWVMGISTIVLAIGAARRLRAPVAAPIPIAGRVAILLPCRGREPHLDDLLIALVRQRLESARLYFVVADEHDPVVPILRQWLATHPGVGRLVIYPLRAAYSGKISNQLGGIEAALEDGSDYLVFLDTDGIPDPDFVARLVGPLATGEAVLTTGGRVLAPVTGSLPEWLASLSIQMTLPWVTDARWGRAWGGAMALRAQDARRYDLARIWLHAYSDDHTLSRAVRQSGGRIAFAPGCLLLLPNRHSWPDLLDFITRQLLVLRIHDRWLWYGAWVALAPPAIILAALIAFLVGQFGWALAIAAALTPVIGAMYALNLAAWRSVGRDEVRLMARPLARQLAIVFAFLWFHSWALLRTARLRRFIWRGRVYKIHRAGVEWVGEDATMGEAQHGI